MAKPTAAKYYDRDALHADALLRGIREELGHASAFTRDDLLYLKTFLHVATITRYHYVCRAVRYCVNDRTLLEVGQNLLILAAGKDQYKKHIHTWDEFEGTVRGLIARSTQADPTSYYNAGSLLELWDSDQYLSKSMKRTILRESLKHMYRKEVIERVDYVWFCNR